MSGWEEEYVERLQGEPNTARLCNEVLARCCVTPGSDSAEALTVVRELLVAERDRELVALRWMSLGSNVSAQVTCPECGEVNQAEFSLDALPLDFTPTMGRVRVELEGGGEAVLRLPPAGDQEELLDVGLVGAAERRSWLLARCLESYGERLDGLDLDFVRSLTVRERRALETAIEERLPDFNLQMAIDCWSCRARVGVPFDVSAFFFSN